MLQAINSGRCVPVHNDDANPGEYMLQYDCNGLTNQQFTWQPISGGFGNIVAQNSGLCLTVSGGPNSILQRAANHPGAVRLGELRAGVHPRAAVSIAVPTSCKWPGSPVTTRSRLASNVAALGAPLTAERTGNLHHDPGKNFCQ
jgi:hypothetical protein